MAQIPLPTDELIGKIVEKEIARHTKDIASNFFEIGRIIGYSSGTTARVDVKAVSTNSTFISVPYASNLVIKANMNCLVFKYSNSNTQTYVVVATWV